MAEAPALAPERGISLDDGHSRVAAVVLAMGPEIARDVLGFFDAEEMRALAHGARELRKAPPEAMTGALREFVDNMGGFGTDLVAGDGLLHDLLAEALGIEAAQTAFAAELPAPAPDEILAPLLDADIDDLGIVLGRERARTVAPLLGALPADVAAEVFERLPAALRADVISCMAKLESVPVELLEGLTTAVLEELKKLGTERGRRDVDGFEAAVQLLRARNEEEQKEALEAIAETNPELADKMKSRIFVFDDISKLMDRDVQALLKEVDVSLLTVALKSASNQVKAKLLANMSKRVAQMLLEDIETLGPVRLSEVEKAREQVAQLVIQLASEGKVTITSGSDSFL